MAKRYIVELIVEERQELLDITNKGKAAAYKIKHANILLRSDANADAWCSFDQGLAFIRATLNGEDHQNKGVRRVTATIQTPEEHVRCPLCA